MEPHQPFSLPKDARTHSLPGHTSEGAPSIIQLGKDARTHSLPGHIFRGSLISHSACQNMPEHTHSLDTFSGASSAIHLPEHARTHSLPGHIFRRGLISHSACQEHTHFLDTFSKGVSSTIQLGRRCQNTLTLWTHFDKEPLQPSSLPEDARTHSHSGHIFRRSLISHPAWQKMPEHTHFLDTFLEGASSAIQLARTQSPLTVWIHF